MRHKGTAYAMQLSRLLWGAEIHGSLASGPMTDDAIKPNKAQQLESAHSLLHVCWHCWPEQAFPASFNRSHHKLCPPVAAPHRLLRTL